MKRIFIITVFLCVSLLPAKASTLDDFLSHLQVVEDMLTERPVFQQMKKLRELSPRRADFVAKFWGMRALSVKGKDINDAGALFEKLRSPTHSKMLKDEDGSIAAGQLNEQLKLIVVSYYYDHIDRIDATIRLNLQKAAAEKK
jgi:hypothetical protein